MKLWLVYGFLIFCLGYGLGGVVFSIIGPERGKSDVLPDSQTNQEVSPVPTLPPKASLEINEPVKSLNTDALLNYSPESLIGKKKVNEVTLLVTGDILLARTIYSNMKTNNDYFFPFTNVFQILKKPDITYINLETPLTSDCKVKTEGTVFCGSLETVEGLIKSGVDIANIANNHAGDQKGKGIIETLKVLRDNNIQVTGVGEPVIKKVDDQSFGFLGYNDVVPRTAGISWADIPDIQQAISKLRPLVDHIVIQFHWGTEYTSKPTKRQIQLAHAAIDAGADLVIGNHPHWVQNTEVYKHKLIAYSHGNFIFDQQWSRPTSEGVVGQYTFTKPELVEAHYFPVIMDANLQTRFASKTESESILSRMK